jgi:hypothetical protein
MSIWEFNLPIKQHNLIRPQYLGIFTRSIANVTSRRGGGGYERMLLDSISIIMCIAYLSIALVWLHWEGVDR